MINMKKILFALSLLLPGLILFAQPGADKDTSWKNEYRETATKINNLVFFCAFEIFVEVNHSLIFIQSDDKIG